MNVRSDRNRGRVSLWLALAGIVGVVALALALREGAPEAVAPLGPAGLDAPGSVEASTPERALPPAAREPSSATTAGAEVGAEPERSERRVATPGVPDDAQWIEGRVAFPPGTPLDEVVVVVARSSRPFEGRDGPDARLSRATVDEHGRFRAAFSKKARTGRLSVEGRYLYDPARYSFSLREPPADVVLEPKLGGRIRVELAPPDALGFEPEELEGARVNGYSFDDGEDVGDRWALLGTDGSFTLDALPAHSSWVVHLTASAFVDEWRDELQVRAGEVTRVALRARRGVRVAGRVVDDEGHALARARVDGTSGDEDSFGASISAMTDESGTFELRGIPPGELSLEARLTGRVTTREPLGARVEGERIEDVELTLSSGLALAGVVRWPDGSPVEGARVQVYEAGDEPGWFDFDPGASSKTAADGRFRFTGLGPIEYTVQATARRADPDAPRRVLNSAPVARGRLLGVPAGRLDLELELVTGGLAHGRVVDDRGQPVERFKVTAYPSDDDEGFTPSDVVTQSFESDDGAFELQGLSAGEHRLRASARGYLTSDMYLSPPPGGGELAIVVRRPASVAGTVLGPSGAVVHGAQVEYDSEQGDLMMLGGVADFAMENMSGSAESSRQGEFRLRKVSPGTVAITADAPGLGASEPLVLELAPGEERTGIVLHLTAPARITGEVHPHAGRVEGRLVRLEGGDYTWETTHSDASGRFAFEGLTAGSYDVSLDALPEEGADEESGLPGAFFITNDRELVDRAEVTVAAGQSEHVVLGEPPDDPVYVFGQVTESGAPVSGWQVACLPQDEDWDDGVAARTLTDEGGMYELVVDGPGTYQLRAGADWSVAHTEQIELAEGAEHRRDIELPTGRITGVVVGPDGPLVGIEVEVTMMRAAVGRTGGVGREVETDEGGRFEALRLPAGSYRVQAGVEAWEWNDGGDPSSLARVVLHGIALEEGEARSDLRIQLSRGGAIEGVVLDASGAPVAGADVWFADLEDTDLFPSDWHETDAAGRFRAAPLRAGPVRVGAYHGETQAETVQTDVPEGGTARVELRLEG